MGDGPLTDTQLYIMRQGCSSEMDTALDEIDRLRAENQRLREALIVIRDCKYCQYYSIWDGGIYGHGVTDGHRYCSKVARKALDPDWIDPDNPNRDWTHPEVSDE